MQNSDERCFGYAVLSALETDPIRPNRVRNYNLLFGRYHLDTIHYPVSIADIPPIEDILHVNINIYGFYDDEGKSRYPLYVSKKKSLKSIDLLFWDNHYAWIKSFSSFMADIVQKHTLFWCPACLGHFEGERALETHKLYCEGINDCGQIFVLPEANFTLGFREDEYLPTVIYSLTA